jgi:hypothetical protein
MWMWFEGTVISSGEEQQNGTDTTMITYDNEFIKFMPFYCTYNIYKHAKVWLAILR